MLGEVAREDVIATAGLRTTAASRMLETFVPSYDATVTARLREAGAVVLQSTSGRGAQISVGANAAKGDLTAASAEEEKPDT